MSNHSQVLPPVITIDVCSALPSNIDAADMVSESAKCSATMGRHSSMCNVDGKTSAKRITEQNTFLVPVRELTEPAAAAAPGFKAKHDNEKLQ